VKSIEEACGNWDDAYPIGLGDDDEDDEDDEVNVEKPDL